MLLIRHSRDWPSDLPGPVVAVGNFDGLHKGHLAVIKTALRRARDMSRPVAVLTFEPHPKQYFHPADPPFRLTPLHVKTRLLEAMEIDALIVLTFDDELAGMTADAFMNEVLIKEIGAAAVVVGDNFAFGQNRMGAAAHLAANGRFVLDLVPQMGDANGPYSSSRAREALSAGDMDAVRAVLGRDWRIENRSPCQARG
ncbi:MAG: FAD synthetase family protein [Pseudomonadota bacterium]|nr:FAD synthetase family protein [Pseudomonadota bacterium]